MTHLEYMERLKLDVLAFISQEVHHHLEVGFICDVACHNVEVGAIQEDFTKELQGLAFCHIVAR